MTKDKYYISSDPVHGHIKRGKYVSSHLHFDILYLMEADDNISLKYRNDESKGIKWIPFEEFDNENMVEFAKLNALKIVKILAKEKNKS